jgi:hypothetical protein
VKVGQIAAQDVQELIQLFPAAHVPGLGPLEMVLVASMHWKRKQEHEHTEVRTTMGNADIKEQRPALSGSYIKLPFRLMPSNRTN